MEDRAVIARCTELDASVGEGRGGVGGSSFLSGPGHRTYRHAATAPLARVPIAASTMAARVRWAASAL
jgi:hypothetical protein